MMCLFIN